jgi:hypothetical protein
MMAITFDAARAGHTPLTLLGMLPGEAHRGTLMTGALAFAFVAVALALPMLGVALMLGVPNVSNVD